MFERGIGKEAVIEVIRTGEVIVSYPDDYPYPSFLMLYYQNVNSAWSSWAYSWTLILVFISIGIIISRAIQGNLSAGIREGGRLIVIGLILFAIFGS